LCIILDPASQVVGLPVHQIENPVVSKHHVHVTVQESLDRGESELPQLVGYLLLQSTLAALFEKVLTN
jgi:hypothetical protein